MKRYNIQNERIWSFAKCTNCGNCADLDKLVELSMPGIELSYYFLGIILDITNLISNCCSNPSYRFEVVPLEEDDELKLLLKNIDNGEDLYRKCITEIEEKLKEWRKIEKL